MKKLFLALIALYTLVFPLATGDFSGTSAMLAVPKVYIEPWDAVLVMLGSLHVDKTLRKRSLGHQPERD